MDLAGRCHCGKLEFTLAWPEATAIPARACGCSFCRKHGGLWTSHPQAALTVRIGDRACVAEYEFGTKTAQFLVCRDCGVALVAVSRIEGRLYAVVSVRALEGVDPATVQAAVGTDFEGETTADRLARRARNWIGTVEIVAG